MYTKKQVFDEIDSICDIVCLNLSYFLPDIYKEVQKWNDCLKEKYNKHGMMFEDKVLKNDSLNGEFFIFTHIFNEIETHFVFMIDKIIGILNNPSHKISPSLIRLEEIQEYNSGSKLAYDPPKGASKKDIDNSSPIIAVPIFWVEGTEFVVVDGNHRVEKGKLMSHSTIRAFLLNPETANSCILGDFEKTLYAFYNWAYRKLSQC